MKAVVMAGGEGTRLRPLTSNQPKPMVPIVGKPCMEHIIELLREHGFEDVIVTVAFLPQAIRSYFGVGENLGVAIEYSVEESPLGTAGSVRLASDKLDETFLVISGHALCDFDFSKELFPLLLEMGRPLYGLPMDGYWQDIGNLDQYRQANFDALDERVGLTVPGIRLRGNIWLGEGVELDDLDQVEGPALISNYCRIAPDAQVAAYS